MEEEQKQHKITKVEPRQKLPRQIIIETDGDAINVTKFETTPLEAAEIFRRLLKKVAKEWY